MKKQNFMRGAAILAIAGAISKAMGAVYRVPLARMIGDEGMGLYQLVYPIYTTVLSLATAGIPVAISVIVAKREAEGYPGDLKQVFRVSLLLLSVLGMFFTVVIMGGARIIAENALHNAKAYWPIMAVAPAIFISSIMAVMRGFFQGQQSMTPTAISQVIEQMFRVSAILIFSICFLPYGLEFAAAGATGGAVIGTFAGLIVMTGFLLHYKKVLKKDGKDSLPMSGISNIITAKELMRLAIPVSMGSIVLPLVQVLDAIIVPGRLQAIGNTVERATGLYGQLSGMAAVLISFSTIFTIAISTSLVPAVSEAHAHRRLDELHERINYGLRAGMIISVPAAWGMFALATPICTLLFANAEAGRSLIPLAFSAITLAAFQLSSAGLQGIGRQRVVMHHLIVIGICKVVFNYLLTSIPSLNIQGAAIGTVMAFCIGAGLNLWSLCRATQVHYEWGRFLKITTVCVVMAASAKGVWMWLNASIGTNYACIGGILTGVIVYTALMIALKELDKELVMRIMGRRHI